MVSVVYINDLLSLMENSTYILSMRQKIIGNKMRLFLLQIDVNDAINWSKENSLEFNVAKIEAICFDD